MKGLGARRRVIGEATGLDRRPRLIASLIEKHPAPARIGIGAGQGEGNCESDPQDRGPSQRRGGPSEAKDGRRGKTLSTPADARGGATNGGVAGPIRFLSTPAVAALFFGLAKVATRRGAEGETVIVENGGVITARDGLQSSQVATTDGVTQALIASRSGRPDKAIDGTVSRPSRGEPSQRLSSLNDRPRAVEGGGPVTHGKRGLQATVISGGGVTISLETDGELPD